MDELPELNEIYSAYPKRKIGTSTELTGLQSQSTASPVASVAACSVDSEDQSFPGPSSAWTQITPMPKRPRTNESDQSPYLRSPRQPTAFLQLNDRSSSFGGSPGRQEDAIESLLRADYPEQGLNHSETPKTSPSHGPFQDIGSSSTQPDTPGIWPLVGLQEACLIRYFIDELACWVSVHSHPIGLNSLQSLISATQSATLPWWYR